MSEGGARFLHVLMLSPRFAHGYPQRHHMPMLLFAVTLGALALFLSIFAAYAGWISLERAETKRLLRLETLVREHETEIESLRSDYLAVVKSWKKLNSRVAMSIAREKKALANGEDAKDGMPDPQKDPAAWRAEMMRRYPKGALSNG